MSDEQLPSTVNSDRREFLSTTSRAIAAGAAISAIGLSAGASKAGVHVAGSDTIRVGLIGCGGRGSGAVIQAMVSQHANVELSAAADVFDGRLNSMLKQAEKQHPGKVNVPEKNRFIGLDAYKKLLDSDVSLVVLATPPGFRPLHFEAAIEAGKHVFMEKPVGVDAPGIRRVLKAAEVAKEKNLSVAVGLQRRHERAYRETISQLQNGAIGELLVARVYWNQGTLWTNGREPSEPEISYQLRNWLYFNWLSGDHIVEQHIHNLDVINWLMNDFPVTARGMGGRQVRLGPEHGQIFDHHMVEYEYASGLKLISQCRQIAGCWTSVSESVFGSTGYCDIDSGKIFDLKGNLVKDNGLRESGHELEQLDLIENLSKGIIQNEAEYGAKSTLTAIMGRLATYTGKVIPWEKLLNSNVSVADVDSLASFDDDAPVELLPSGEYPVPVPGSDWKNHIDWDADA